MKTINDIEKSKFYYVSYKVNPEPGQPYFDCEMEGHEIAELLKNVETYGDKIDIHFSVISQ